MGKVWEGFCVCLGGVVLVGFGAPWVSIGAHAGVSVYRAMVMSKPENDLGGGTPLPWHQDLKRPGRREPKEENQTGGAKQ